VGEVPKQTRRSAVVTRKAWLFPIVQSNIYFERRFVLPRHRASVLSALLDAMLDVVHMNALPYAPINAASFFLKSDEFSAFSSRSWRRAWSEIHRAVSLSSSSSCAWE
jgi:hypothetical protein